MPRASSVAIVRRANGPGPGPATGTGIVGAGPQARAAARRRLEPPCRCRHRWCPHPSRRRRRPKLRLLRDESRAAQLPSAGHAILFAGHLAPRCPYRPFLRRPRLHPRRRPRDSTGATMGMMRTTTMTATTMMRRVVTATTMTTTTEPAPSSLHGRRNQAFGAMVATRDSPADVVGCAGPERAARQTLQERS